MLNRATLAKIHIARKETGMDDDVYRSMLHGRWGVESSSNLTERQAAELLQEFRNKGWKPKPRTTAKKSRDFVQIKAGPAAKQQRKVLAMWAALGYSVAKLHARCKRQFGIERIEWVTAHEDLHVLITDLQKRLDAMKTKGGKK